MDLEKDTNYWRANVKIEFKTVDENNVFKIGSITKDNASKSSIKDVLVITPDSAQEKRMFEFALHKDNEDGIASNQNEKPKKKIVTLNVSLQNPYTQEYTITVYYTSRWFWKSKRGGIKQYKIVNVKCNDPKIKVKIVNKEWLATNDNESDVQIYF